MATRPLLLAQVLPFVVMLFSHTLSLFWTLASLVTARDGAKREGFTTVRSFANTAVRYKQVAPGICEQDPTIKSFSGYIDISPDEHLFFWFFETRTGGPSKAPLTAWINGGPGSSSMRGLFQENGPCYVDSHGNVVTNPYSWSNSSNLIYIDQPAGVGFSYSTATEGQPYSVTESTVKAAPIFWRTLQGFRGAFPQYSQNDFHLATESYGGHFGPIFSMYIAEQNAACAFEGCQIKQKSLLIGNGWYDPEIQFQAHYNFTVSPGNTYDFMPFNDSTSSKMYESLYGAGKCLDQLRSCSKRGTNEACRAADTYCIAKVESLLKIHSNRFEFDIRAEQPHQFPANFYLQYLGSSTLQDAIGVSTDYHGSSESIIAAFDATGDDARRLGILDIMVTLLEMGIGIAMYAGDADYSCNWLGGETVAHEVGLRLSSTGLSTAGYMNISTTDDVVHGQVKQSGILSFSRIYDSGHEVPAYQPLVSLAIFGRAISGRDIATGGVKVGNCYKTPGETTSSYRQVNASLRHL
jgi:carboxypeptidase C (cathepsin A)